MKKRSTMSEILSNINLYKKKLDNVVMEDKLYQKSNDRGLVAIKKESEDTFGPNKRSKTDMKDAIDAKYKSIVDIMENFQKLTIIKNGVNATMKIVIAGKSMTIAEALSYNNTVVKDYHTIILRKMKDDYEAALRSIDDYNSKVFSEEAINKYIALLVGGSDNVNDVKNKDPKRIQEYIEMYHKQNDMEIYDPLNLLEKIKEKERFITEFYHDIGFVLASINSQLIVEYDLDEEVPHWTIVNAEDLKSLSQYLSDLSEEE